jgi:hypothetical protein
MNERTAQTGLVAIACGALGLAMLAVTSLAEAFEPCRMRYRLPQAVQDSLACHVHSALGIAALLFLAAAVGVGAVAVIFACFRRS